MPDDFGQDRRLAHRLVGYAQLFRCDAAEEQYVGLGMSLLILQVIEITTEQMGAMCGNILELEDGRGLPVMAMSTQAHNAFTLEQRRDMRKHVAALHHAPLDTIEYIGGGGVRCSLAELF
jgi:hypothetical protein